jgi:soluble lytic murein transglycosylase-like protein
MAVQLGLSSAGDRGVGLRHDMERRVGNRRAYTRGTPERRRSDRRRAKLRSLIFTSLALAAPHQLKNYGAFNLASNPLTNPQVSTSISNVFALSPRHAYEGIIREAAALYRVDANLIRSVMQAESAFDPTAVSRTGAMGLMQLMPPVAKAFDVENPFDPRENIMAGTRLLRELLDSHHGNVALTLASYNAGPTAVARYRGVPPFRETRGYVKKITNLLADARNAANND